MDMQQMMAAAGMAPDTSSATQGVQGTTPSLLTGGNGEPKGQLIHFCQLYCKRPITKSDIVYNAAKYGDVYQVTVTLNCVEGQRFVGETAATEKEAEKNAAYQALVFFQPISDSLPPPVPKTKNKKRKTPGAGADGADGEQPALKALKMGGADPQLAEGVNPALTSKVLLNNVCMTLMRRPMEKGEIAYTTNKTPIGYQSTLKLPFLPGEWGQLAWAGEVATQQKQAEQNAAKEALEAMNQGMDTITSLLPPAPVKQQWPCGKSSKGKGKMKGGKNKGWDYGWDFGWDSWDSWDPWGMKGMMFGMDKGYGKGMDMGMGKGKMDAGMGKGMNMGMAGWAGGELESLSAWQALC